MDYIIPPQEKVEYHKTLEANSYEFGTAGKRFKLYFENAAQLKVKIEELIKLGLYVEDVITQ